MGLGLTTYQTIDKPAGYITYMAIALVGRKWEVGKLTIVLFLLKTIGQILFFVTGNEVVFFGINN